MRLPLFVAAVAFLFFAFWTQPVHARGGKGGGGGGGGHARGGGPQIRGSGHGGGMKHTTHQPAKDKVTRTAPTKDKVLKDKAGGSAKDQAGFDKTAKSQKPKSQKTRPADDSSADDSGTGDDSGTAGETPNKKEKQLANFQRQRDKKIAQADHLRQIAERNGNANLAANADRMEAQALEQYAQKVSHLEKFGVTDPELDAGGGGGTDPVDPGTDTGGDPLADPLGTLQSLLPFGR